MAQESWSPGYTCDMESRCERSTEGVATLIIFGGLPGVGKTAIARELARCIQALYLRIDSIEQAILASGVMNEPINDAGYRVAYAVAEENLRIGRTVVADSVNPISLTREAWVSVAIRAGARAIEIEVECSNVDEHRRRVEMRTADIPGLRLPTWREVVERDYHPWDRQRLMIDTAGRTIEENVDAIRQSLR
jgi:predicted kinase